MPITIPIIQPGAYTTNRVLIDPITQEAMNSDCNNCSFKIGSPCPYVKSFRTITFRDIYTQCLPSWCSLIEAVKSIASSQLLTTDGDGNITTPLTTAEKNSLEIVSKMILA